MGGLNVAYSPLTGGFMNSNWRFTVEGKQKRYFMKLSGAGTDSFSDPILAKRLLDALAREGSGRRWFCSIRSPVSR